MKKVLFIDSVHDVLQQRLEAAGYICELHYKTGHAELLDIAPEFFGTVVRSRITIDKEFMDSATQLKFIARSGSGLENIDVDYAASKGIEVINSPEGNRDAVGEHAMGMLLMLLNNLKQADTDVRAGRWPREENRGYEIAGKTVGLIGYGIMGSSLAEKLAGFRANVIAFDKYKKGFTSAIVKETSLEEIYSEADVVSLHLPLTAETHFYANAEFFGRFRKPIYFINTARGKNTDTGALVAALRSGQVKGACLDVIEYEKISLEGLENERETEDLRHLIEAKNVILSPHVAGWTHESYYKLSDVLADKILSRFGNV
jgi:D-3-phosphoglycerate dehydrogenase / 2-oxoglutarate reductase